MNMKQVQLSATIADCGYNMAIQRMDGNSCLSHERKEIALWCFLIMSIFRFDKFDFDGILVFSYTSLFFVPKPQLVTLAVFFAMSHIAPE